MNSPLVVLLVEDEVLVADLLVDALQDCGFEVEYAACGSAAAQTLSDRARRFCCLVTDINLPGEFDGWSLADQARSSAPGIGVVYMTGDSERGWLDKGVDRSVLLAKPFNPSQVVLAVAGLTSATKPDADA